MRVLAGLVALVLSGVAGCGEPAGDDTDLLVFAAASLTDVFAELEGVFEASHPGVDVVVSVAGSQRLAAQILEGAPADVFASADSAQMDRVVAAGEADGAPRVFARNRLAIAVERGNPQAITGPADLARDDLTVVLAGEEVPIGAYTRALLGRAGVDVDPASLELDVRAVLSRVSLGEADAGVVYASDLIGRDDVAAVDIPDEMNVSAAYPIVVLDGADPVAREFVALLLSDEGVSALTDAGFVAP